MPTGMSNSYPKTLQEITCSTRGSHNIFPSNIKQFTMKLAFATALMASSAAAFSPSFSAPNTALKMSAVETEVYTFDKSEEIFAEAKNVS